MLLDTCGASDPDVDADLNMNNSGLKGSHSMLKNPSVAV